MQWNYATNSTLDIHDLFLIYSRFTAKDLDFTKTGNEERGTENGERGTGNGERETGNGERETGNGERETGNGERETENGKRETRNGKRGRETVNWKRGTGNRERESGNECTAITRLRVQHGGQRKRKENNLGKCKEVLRL